ncbi:coatomer subunit zeta-1 isoform X1 [Macaca fascicularis]|uniref:coatomer subunit zeta-1 isoform X1 n=1 Tax=Macaca fascicularis TaxID=9541 RepID=UPI001E2579CE|nr:coatomer subunit zeta-1 isoform X1 [Macaca fascicularis]
MANQRWRYFCGSTSAPAAGQDGSADFGRSWRGSRDAVLSTGAGSQGAARVGDGEGEFREPSLYTVKAILILDNDGDRLFAKYYDDTYPSVKEQKAFEKNIFNKTHRTDSEIALLEGLTVVYKSSIDLYFYVIGSSYENELMLMAVLNCLFDSLSQMLRKNVEKRALLENMEGLFLAVDEIVDGGVILESDPQQVVHRVALRGEDVPLTEQTVSQVLQSAKEQIKWSLLR